MYFSVMLLVHGGGTPRRLIDTVLRHFSAELYGLDCTQWMAQTFSSLLLTVTMCFLTVYYLTNIMFYTNCCRTLLATHIHFATDGITTLLVIKLIQMSVILSLVYFTRICTEHYYVCLLLHNLYFHFIYFILISFHVQVAL